VSAKDFVFDAVRPPPLIKPPFLFKVVEDHISTSPDKGALDIARIPNP
jgi:hypothetical protein